MERACHEAFDKHVFNTLKTKPHADTRFISQHASWNIIQDNPDQRWVWYDMSQNPNITLETIRGKPDKAWDWQALSLRIPIDVIQAN